MREIKKSKLASTVNIFILLKEPFSVKDGLLNKIFFLPKEKRGKIRLCFIVYVYFLRSSRNTAIPIAAIIAIVDPARYVSVIGAGVGVGVGSGSGASIEVR